MNDETKPAKKPYDPTMSFSVFGSWFETMERLRTSQGVETAYSLFTAIANYSRFYECPDFEDGSILQIFWPVIQKEIDLSLKRRGANFSSEEADERRRLVIAAYSENPSLSAREIEERTGVSKSAVGRILKRWREEQESDRDKEEELEQEEEIDTMGLGRDGTVGQSKDIDPIGCSLSDWENLSEEERKEFSLLDRIQARIASVDWEQLEILQNDKANNDRVIRTRHKWSAAYMAWRQSIADESVILILEKYLSTHAETAIEKRWGDRYGRIVNGWDAEKQEPIIVYSVTGEFPQGTRHSIASIPVTYYRVEEDAAEVKEETEWFNNLSDADRELLECSDELPF